MARGPDFMCVGMHKGGTRWLSDQLQHHADFWMPPIKELHYFDKGRKRGRNALQALQYARGESDRPKTQSNKSREWDERDFAFLEEMAGQIDKPLRFQPYARMFQNKGSLKSGDITPHYCSLEEDLIAAINGHFPDLRIVLLVRDPIKRAWSNLSQLARNGGFDETILERPDRFHHFLESNEHFNRLCYASRAATTWSRYVDADRFRYFFMDDIAADAARVRKDILLFLDADPEKPSGALPPDHNPKSKYKKLEMSPAIGEILVDFFADELRACATVFGGHANTWQAEYLG